jgi:phosphoenolpyruvate-protein phosphotransferase
VDLVNKRQETPKYNCYGSEAMKTITVERIASRGIAMGKAYVVKRPEIVLDTAAILPEQTDEEIARFDRAVELAKSQLKPLAESSKIFAAHLELATDFALRDGVMTKIRHEKRNVEAALSETVASFVQIFESMEDEYMRERAVDIKDVLRRILLALKGVCDTAISDIREQVIVVAADLTPSDTACMNLDYVLGFVTEEGGVTGHVSIMARSLNLPAIVGVEGIMSGVNDGDYLIMDAVEGSIIINPTDGAIREYQHKKQAYDKRWQELTKMSALPPETSDGKRVSLCANVGSVEDVKNALPYNIDGVGLFRTEFLYMDNTHFPSEEEQFAAYKAAAELLSGRELTIRTLDIGGDKKLKYYEFDYEENPFLGWRAIRISLSMEDVFKAQLRALLRASAFGRIRIMFPMIISIEELEEAKCVLENCKQELRGKGKAFDEHLEVGMMIETPASVILIDDFAARVDFFSIGTNDLTQYTLAVDRGNKKVADIYDPFHPAVLRSIKKTIDAGHAAGIKVGMCGEFAGDPKAQKLLLGMGLDEFSMSASAIPESRYAIRAMSYLDAQQLAERVVTKTVSGT